MRTRKGVVVTINLVTISVLAVFFTFDELETPNNRLPLSETTPTETMTSTTLKISLPDRWVYIVLEKWSSIPETYVRLTEEEVAMFPALQTVLKAFKGSKRTEYWYKTSEQEAQDIQRYIWERYEDKYS